MSIDSLQTQTPEVKTCRCRKWEWDEKGTTPAWCKRIGQSWVHAGWTKGRCYQCGTWMFPGGETKEAPDA